MSDSDSPGLDHVSVETHAGPCPWCDAAVVDGECSRDACEFEMTPN